MEKVSVIHISCILHASMALLNSKANILNKLQYETSPYLLQHANNPVDWYAWKPEAFERARAENKPILVSIGYSTCHWCHVMEHESFEDEATAALMNEHFINIKVDREERPDVDQIYMEACQIVSGSGGWPLNCFLTPDARPFYAATYFPPTPAYNRPSWKQVLENIAHSFQTRRDEVEAQADKLMDIINGSDSNLLGNVIEGLKPEQVFTPVALQNIFFQLQKRFDEQDGGFGGAPKFPGTMSLCYLLNYHHFTGEEAALEHLERSLDRMIQGGIYDQIGGGFSRYTVDNAWLIPHFEKMLYDNALLVGLISDAYKVTKKELYKESIEETLDFIAREMTSPESGFYAAQDADSEGVEGKYYVWDKSEIDTILGEEAPLFNAFYDVSEEGNWEHKTIFQRKQSFEAFAAQENIELASLKNRLKASREKLFAVRDKRVHPGLDDKILLDWNALMCSAYAKAYTALDKEAYREIAIRNLDFLLEKFQQTDSKTLYHTYKDGQVQYDAFLNDYAYLIAALVDVYEISLEFKYLEAAKNYCELVLTEFFDEASNLFYFTSSKQTDIIARKKDIYDSAVPSGNSTMVHNLQRLGILLGKSNYKELARTMLLQIQTAVERYPSSLSRWANAFIPEVHGKYEVAIIGEHATELTKALNKYFIPNKVLLASEQERVDYPLLSGRAIEKDTFIYVCHDFVCQRPVRTIEEALKLM